MTRVNQRKRKRKKVLLRLSIILFLSLIVIAGLIIGSMTLKTKGKVNASLNQSTLSTSSKSSSLSSQTMPSHTNPSTSIKTTTQWLSSKSENQLPILMFHYVIGSEDQLPQDSNSISVERFEAELSALKSGGYTTLSATDAERVITQKLKPSNKMVWLTFDDGSVTMYTRIFPLLKKYHMHATSFIITGFVDNNQGGILNWEQIKEMKKSGLVDFGSHTVDHPDLGTLSSEKQREELANSKADLDKNLGQNTDLICYPAGGYNSETLNLDQTLGYQFGFLDPGRNGAQPKAAGESDGLLTLPRFRMMDSTTPEEMLAMLQPATYYNEQN